MRATSLVRLAGPSGRTPGGCKAAKGTWMGPRGWPASRHHQGAQHSLAVPWTQFRDPGEARACGWWFGGISHRGRILPRSRAPSLSGAAGRPVLSAALSPQDLGVTKVGHMKRILCGIKELSRGVTAAAEA